MATGTYYQSENITAGSEVGRFRAAAGGLGILSLAIAAIWGFAIGDGMSRFFHSYLWNYAYFLTFPIGALTFVVIQHLVKSQWSVVVRRIPEMVVGTFPLMAALSLVFLLPLLFGNHSLYLWSDGDAVLKDHILKEKAGWLNPPFFFVRILFYLAFYTVVGKAYLRLSTKQDATGDASLTTRMRNMSGPIMIALAVVIALTAFDLLMSLEPHWFSTIYGVYFFGGSQITVYSTIILIAAILQANDRLSQSITVEHYHDLGKLLLAFILFWAYIGFSQFMLIWYGNMPEETHWFAIRMFTGSEHGFGYGWLSLFLILFHFAFPFVCLMSRWSKRIPIGKKKIPMVTLFAVYMLGVHWIDIYWLAMPSYSLAQTEPSGSMPTLVFHPIDIFNLVGIGSLFVAGVLHQASKYNLLCIKDPNLSASRRFVNQ